MTEEVETKEEVTKEVIEEPKIEAPINEELKEVLDENKDQVKPTEEEQEKPADTPSTDIVFPEDTSLSEEQQSEVREIFGTQEVYDKAISFLEDISSEQTAKDTANAEAKAIADEESLKKDPVFGKDYNENMKKVEDYTNGMGEDFAKAVDIKNPVVAKALLAKANLESDAKIHVETSKKTVIKPQIDSYGNPMGSFDNTLNDLKERT